MTSLPRIQEDVDSDGRSYALNCCRAHYQMMVLDKRQMDPLRVSATSVSATSVEKQPLRSALTVVFLIFHFFWKA